MITTTIIKMRLVSNIGRKLALLSNEVKPQKSLSKYLKAKRAEEEAAKIEASPQVEDELQSAHYLLYAQFVPAVLIAIPTLAYLSTPTELVYLQSCNMLQYYASGLLSFNSFFTEGKPSPN
jgi:hypothetical protein